jgi:hypothetical protein
VQCREMRAFRLVQARVRFIREMGCCVCGLTGGADVLVRDQSLLGAVRK